MVPSDTMVTPIGQTLTVAAALGKSLGTLLGPTTAAKMLYQPSNEGSLHWKISSDPVTLLRGLDIEHPVGTLVLEALEGMELAFGTGVTFLATLCGVLSTACRRLQEEGVPRNSMIYGLQVAEDACVVVLRGLSLRTVDFGQVRERIHDHIVSVGPRDSTSGYTASGEPAQQGKQGIRRQAVSMPLLASLAAGLQHSAGCEDTTTEQGADVASNPASLSLPAALALNAVAALLSPDDSDESGDSGSGELDLTRVHTRLKVGPESGASFVVPAAASIEISPWERVAVQEAFVQPRCPCGALRGGKIRDNPLPNAISTMSVAAVAIVLGDVSATASASGAAARQMPLTHVLRDGRALLQRYADSGSEGEQWVGQSLLFLRRLGVEALVTTGEVCPLLKEALQSGGFLVLSEVSNDEATAVGLATGATPVPGLDLLTCADVGRGHRPNQALSCNDDSQAGVSCCTSQSSDCHRKEYRACAGREQCPRTRKPDGTFQLSPSCCADRTEDDQHRRNGEEWSPGVSTGIVASLIEAGTAGDDQKRFSSVPGSQVGLGMHGPDLVVLLHQCGGVTDHWGAGRGAETSDAKIHIERAGGGRANVVVVVCGPFPSACEELRHRFWRVARRLSSALSEGLVLPGAGACEVVCAANLELEAMRLEEESAGEIEEAKPRELYTPMVLRSVAAALDEALLACMANAGHLSSIALRRLSVAKKTARRHLLQEGRPFGLTIHPSGARPPALYVPCLKWGFCRGLAAVSTPGTADDNFNECSAEMSGKGSKSASENIVWPLRLEGEPARGRDRGVAMVLDSFGAKIGCFERAIGLAGLLAGSDGILLSPSPRG